MKARAGTNTGFVSLGDDLPIEASKELYANYGLAIYVANVLEYSIIYALFALELGPKYRQLKSQDEWDSAYDEFFERAFSITFGHLVNRLTSHAAVPAEMAETLKVAKGVRDNLVHRFAKETAELFYSEKGRREIIENCEGAVALFEACHDDVEEITARQFEKMGIDPAAWTARIEQEMNRLIAEAGATN
jgi:hypothetical protein